MEKLLWPESQIQKIKPEFFNGCSKKTYDDKGNIVYYEYKAEDRANIPNVGHESHRSNTLMANRYPKRIKYGNTLPFNPGDATFFDTTDWHFEVVMDYGEHGGVATPGHAEIQPWAYRHDPFSVYTPGFELRTYRLCKRILMYHNFPELGCRSLSDMCYRIKF